MAVILNASTSSGFVQSADTSGEINLQSNGSTKLTVASTGVSGTLVQGTAVASTSGTSIDFTGIPSWAKRITVMFSGVSTSGTSILIVQVGDAGGVENTGYAGVVDSAAAAAASSSAGWSLFRANAATSVYSGTIVLRVLTGNLWVIDTNICNTDANQSGFTSGTKTLSDTLTQVRITTVNGTDTFDAGTINIQYEG